MGYDELLPLTKLGKNSFGGVGAMVVDSLDTLWLMGLREEFDRLGHLAARALRMVNARAVLLPNNCSPLLCQHHGHKASCLHSPKCSTPGVLWRAALHLIACRQDPAAYCACLEDGSATAAAPSQDRHLQMQFQPRSCHLQA